MTDALWHQPINELTLREARDTARKLEAENLQLLKALRAAQYMHGALMDLATSTELLAFKDKAWRYLRYVDSEFNDIL